MEYVKYIITPFICALIGWFTNFLAVKMLFHPRKEIKILFFKLHGIFPKRQKELAHNLGEAIEKELISFSDLERYFKNQEFNDKYNDIIEKAIDKFLQERLVSINPMIAMFLNDDMTAKIKTIMFDEIKSILPQFMQRTSDELKTKINFKNIVKEKVELFPMGRLENLLFAIMKKEFKFIEFIGGLLGFIIGLFQALIFYFF